MIAKARVIPMMKKCLVWIMVLGLFMGLVPAAMAEDDDENYDVSRHNTTFFVEGLPVTLNLWPMDFAFDQDETLTQEKFNNVKEIRWLNLPSDAVVDNALGFQNNGFPRLPWAAFQTSAATQSREVTVFVETKDGQTSKVGIEVKDSQLKNTGALDQLPGISYVNNAFYLRVQEGQTITLPNYLTPKNPSADTSYEYFWSYGDPNQGYEYPVNQPAVYTVNASDNGKPLYFYYRLLEDEEVISWVNGQVILVLDETTCPIPENPFDPRPAAPAAPSVPKTGDSSQLLLWSAMALGSLLAAAVLLKRRSRSC